MLGEPRPVDVPYRLIDRSARLARISPISAPIRPGLRPELAPSVSISYDISQHLDYMRCARRKHERQPGAARLEGDP